MSLVVVGVASVSLWKTLVILCVLARPPAGASLPSSPFGTFFGPIGGRVVIVCPDLVSYEVAVSK